MSTLLTRKIELISNNNENAMAVPAINIFGESEQEGQFSLAALPRRETPFAGNYNSETSLFLDRRHARLVPWPRGTRVVNRVGVGSNVQTNRKFVRREYNRWKPNDMSN